MNNLNDGWLMEVYNKPTNCQQICSHCNKRLIKDDKTVKILANMYYNYPRYIYFHYKCYIYCLLRTFKGDLKTSKKITDELMVDKL